ncbi:MAG: hypothetical protein ACYC5F_02630 [Thermoleophilia bacterium]
MIQCKAKSKRTGKRCQARAVTGKDVCYHHGGKTPVKHGLYSKFPEAVAAEHLKAAMNTDRLDILKSTIALLAGILSRWTEQGISFDVEHFQATCTLSGRLTKAISEYEKLTNPELRSGKLQLNYEHLSDAELIAEAETLLLEAKGESR